MSVYKRGNTWWVCIYPRGGGAPIRRSSRSTVKRNALALERELKRELENRHTRGLQGLRPAYTWTDALTKFASEGYLAKSMTTHFKMIVPHLRGHPLESLSAVSSMKTSMLATGVKNTTKGLSPLTVNRRLSVVQRILSVAYTEWDWLEQPIAEKITPMKLSEKGSEREYYLSIEEFKAFTQHITNPKAKRVICIAVFSGMRLNEILSLRPEDRRPHGVRLAAANTKSSKPRSIPLPEYIVQLLDPLPIGCSARTVQYWWEKARMAEGRPEIQVRDLRHSYASWLAEDPNVPLIMIRDLLGHSSLNVTNRYSHIRDSALKQAIINLPEL